MVQRKETRSSLNLFSVSRRNVMTSNRHIQAPAAAAGGRGGGEIPTLFSLQPSPPQPFYSAVWSGMSTPTIWQNLRLQGAPRSSTRRTWQRCGTSPVHAGVHWWGREVHVPPRPPGHKVFRFLRFLTFQLLQNTVNAEERLILRWTASWSIPHIIHTHFIFRVTFSHRATPILA